MAGARTSVQPQDTPIVPNAADSLGESCDLQQAEALQRRISPCGAAKRRAKGKKAAAKPPPRVEEAAASLDASEREVLAAISGLYDDSLRPYGRLVRKRLAEHALAQRRRFDASVGLDLLRSACEVCAGVEVETEKGGEWVALIDGREQEFVDYFGKDVFPASMWFAFKSYLAMLEGDAALFPPGRYDCARALLERRLPFLSGRSVGQVCHIIELSMSQRKLLGYIDGAITPYARSQTKVKDDAAECRMGDGTEHFPVATWETVRSHLSDILASAAKKGKKHVALSTLKRLFRSRFRSELSETALGYTRISNLLEDPQVSDICSVRLLKSGYVLLPRSMSRVPTDSSMISEGATSTSSMEPVSCEEGNVRSKWSSCSSHAVTKKGELRNFVHDTVLRTALCTEAFEQLKGPASGREPELAPQHSFGCPSEVLGAFRASLGPGETTPRCKAIWPSLGLELSPFLGSVQELPELPELEALGLPRSGCGVAPPLRPGSPICERMPKLWLDRPPSFEGLGVRSARSQKSAAASPLLTRSPRYDWAPHRAERMTSMPELHALDKIALGTPHADEGSAALCTFTPALRTFTPREAASVACDPASRFTFSFGHACPVDAGVEVPCWSTPTGGGRSVSLEDEVLLAKGFGRRLAIPSPAMTASDWGTPRTPALRPMVCLADLV